MNYYWVLEKESRTIQSVLQKHSYIICVFFSQVQQANVDDEEIARAINSKLGETPGISYSEIASKAVDCGRTQLAIKVGHQEWIFFSDITFSVSFILFWLL